MSNISYFLGWSLKQAQLNGQTKGKNPFALNGALGKVPSAPNHTLTSKPPRLGDLGLTNNVPSQVGASNQQSNSWVPLGIQDK